jgi:hypothetical protein
MPYCYDIFPEHNLMVIRWLGETTYQDVMDLIEEVSKDKRFVPYAMNVLADYSHGSSYWNAKMMDRMLPQLQSRMPIRRVALLVPDSLITLMNLREMAYKARAAGRDAAAFDCPLEAVRWLWTDEDLPSLERRCTWHRVRDRVKALP